MDMFSSALFKAKLNSHRGDRLKKRLNNDTAVQEDLQIKVDYGQTQPAMLGWYMQMLHCTVQHAG